MLFQCEIKPTSIYTSSYFARLEWFVCVTCATFRTADEDFGILLEAALMYDRRVAAILGEDDSLDEEVIWKEMSDGKQCLYPRLLFIITGIIFVFPPSEA